MQVKRKNTTVKIKLPGAFLVMLCGLAYCAILPARADWDPLDPFSPTRSQVIESYHQAGLNGDRSRIPEMIHVLQTHGSADIQKTLLVTLARLGAIDALPAFDAVIQNKLAPTPAMLSNFAQAARARLLAETEPTPQTQAERFFKELGETPTQFNAVLTAYEIQRLDVTRIQSTHRSICRGRTDRHGLLWPLH